VSFSTSVWLGNLGLIAAYLGLIRVWTMADSELIELPRIVFYPLSLGRAKGILGCSAFYWKFSLSHGLALILPNVPACHAQSCHAVTWVCAHVTCPCLELTCHSFWLSLWLGSGCVPLLCTYLLPLCVQLAVGFPKGLSNTDFAL
jgi:hypothetical protein